MQLYSDVTGGTCRTIGYQSDAQRSDDSPEGQRPPQIMGNRPGRERPLVPPPPQFYDGIYVATTLRPPQAIQLLSDGDDTDQVSTPREVNQPQGEPEPEMPGGTEPSESDRTSRLPEGETGDQNDEEESPDHTDTDPYGDPIHSQADVEQTPDTEQVVLVDSPDESPVEREAVVNPEPASISQETPPATTTEVASGVSQETISTDESIPKGIYTA